ncbi:hypothetical protein C8D85_2510 [Marinomonas communis]|uniref:Uncharacterized protein n=1 Tax=Marinomonas communis TaxID=28254 RepID=A0A4R6X0V8_9GAMM|nr:hypothetical protein C8D85_2510 [Marinomonas communis]
MRNKRVAPLDAPGRFEVHPIWLISILHLMTEANLHIGSPWAEAQQVGLSNKLGLQTDQLLHCPSI